MENKYFAFISYRSTDEKWAKWLAHKLEYYRLPSSLNGKNLPSTLRPIFRDIDELSAGNLPNQIYTALSQSQNLIVICSPDAAKSEWVRKEIEDFINLKGESHVFPFIIKGIPYALNSDDECFPLPLRNLPRDKERLGGNVNETDRESAITKIIAGMLGVSYDTLWQRYKKEQRKEQERLKAESWHLKTNQARSTASIAMSLIQEKGCFEAIRLCLEVLPKNRKYLNFPLVPEVDGVLRILYDLLHYNSHYSLCYIHLPVGYNTDNVLLKSYDCNYIISCCSHDDTIDIIRTNDSKHLCTLHGESVAVSNVRNVIAVTQGNRVRFYDIKTGYLLRRILIKEEDNVTNISLSCDDCFLAAVIEFERVIIYDLTKESLFYIEKEVFNPVISVFNHKVTQVAVLDSSGEITIFDIRGNCLVQGRFYDMGCLDLVLPKFYFSEDDNRLFFSSKYTGFQVYDLYLDTISFVSGEDMPCDYPLLEESDFNDFSGIDSIRDIDDLTFIKSKNEVVAITSNRKLLCWKKGHESRKTLLLHLNYQFNKFIFLESKASVVILTNFTHKKNVIEFWDYKKKKRKMRIESSLIGEIKDFSLNQDDSILYILNQDNEIIVWDVSHSMILNRYKFPIITLADANSSNSSCDFDPFVHNSSYLLQKICPIGAGVLCCIIGEDFSSALRDDNIILKKSNFQYKLDGKLILIDTRNGYREMFGYHPHVKSILYHSQRNYIITIGSFEIHIWAIKTKKKLGSITSRWYINKVVLCHNDMIAVLLSSGEISVYSCHKQSHICDIKLEGSTKDIIYNRDNNSLFVLGHNHIISEYSMTSFTKIYSLNIDEYLHPKCWKSMGSNIPFGIMENHLIIGKWKFKFCKMEDIRSELQKKFSSYPLSEEEKHTYFLD